MLLFFFLFFFFFSQSTVIITFHFIIIKKRMHSVAVARVANRRNRGTTQRERLKQKYCMWYQRTRSNPTLYGYIIIPQCVISSTLHHKFIIIIFLYYYYLNNKTITAPIRLLKQQVQGGLLLNILMGHGINNQVGTCSLPFQCVVGPD